jgi:hypothetical protein
MLFKWVENRLVVVFSILITPFYQFTLKNGLKLTVLNVVERLLTKVLVLFGSWSRRFR